MPLEIPDIDTLRARRRSIESHILRTPVVACPGIEEQLAAGTRVQAKLEFLQRTGTFKARGALSSLQRLSPEQRAAGVTAVSAGNHAIAVAYAARALGIDAKVVMIRSANPWRVRRCESFGAEVVKADDVHAAFEQAERIEREEGRFLVHPFEGRAVAEGTGTLGLEICEQAADFDALIVPVGGGGLLGGVAAAVRQLRPGCRIVGVEPEGADTMRRSFAAGAPRSIDRVRTIADSLGAPFALPYSFELCRRYADEIVLVSDRALASAMRLLFRRMRIAVEPACAAAAAALLGPLAATLAGRRVMLLMCGSNMDWPTFSKLAELP